MSVAPLVSVLKVWHNKKNSILGAGMYGIQKFVLHVVGFIPELSQLFYIAPLKPLPVGVCSVHDLCQL